MKNRISNERLGVDLERFHTVTFELNLSAKDAEIKKSKLTVNPGLLTTMIVRRTTGS